ncbi:MAG: cupin domain-containing protein [Spirochaetes bacterium]|nr:cupin domain-containing protein [Spirochaetota bacterium]
MAVVRHFSEIGAIPVDADGAVNTTKRLLLGSGDGVPLFSVRMFEVGPGGRTPSHSHDFEHEIFVLEGSGTLVTASERLSMPAGSALFIPPMERHHMENGGESIMRILCMVPKEYE